MNISTGMHRRDALKTLTKVALGVTSSVSLAPFALAQAGLNKTALWDIVQIVDTSTLQQDVSKDFLIGARAAWQAINAQGGLQGRPVRHVVLEVDETQASVRKAIRAVQSSRSSLVISGTVGDGAAQVVTQSLKEESINLAHVAPWLQNSDRALGKNTFPICADRQKQIAHAAAYLAGVGIKEFGIVYASAQEQATHKQEIERIAQTLKVKVVHVPAPALNNLQALGQTLPANLPSVQLFVGGTPELIEFVQGLEMQNRTCFIIGLSDVSLQAIQQLGVAKKTTVIVAQSVPRVSSGLAIVQSYKATMARYFDEPATPLSLAGFISARYTYEVLSQVRRPLNPQVALDAFSQRASMDLGGYKISYDGDLRGSQYVTLSMIGKEGNTLG